jgi:hypothetical protein
MELVAVLDPNAAVFTVLQIFVDDPTCIAVEGVLDASMAIEGVEAGESTDLVVELDDERWGMSWIGTGWRCDGPHPFSE